MAYSTDEFVGAVPALCDEQLRSSASDAGLIHADGDDGSFVPQHCWPSSATPSLNCGTTTQTFYG